MTQLAKQRHVTDWNVDQGYDACSDFCSSVFNHFNYLSCYIYIYMQTSGKHVRLGCYCCVVVECGVF